jgi:tripartite-type tricarboxylate transporter receptor subunit TctC
MRAMNAQAPLDRRTGGNMVATASRITGAGVVLSAWVVLLAGGSASAQTFPSRPVTLIVPYAAGGSTDVTFRALAAATEKYLGQSIVIENRPGASGTMAPAQMAASAKPDGYTICQIFDAVWRAPFLGKTTFDPAVDFTYVIGVTGYTWGLVVNKNAPWKTFRELLAGAKANPGKINYGTTGAFTTPELTMERIARQQGITWVGIPFKGNSEQINALLGGHIDSIASSTGWAAQVDSGEFRLLVTFGAARTKSWPMVPTLRETGIDMVVDSPYGIAGPKDIDPKIVKILHDAFKKGMDEPTFVTTMNTLNQEFLYKSSDDFRTYVLKQIEEERTVIGELGLKAP